MTGPWDTLDAEVRRVDEDRWLASRFAASDVRRRLVALYAVNYELARTSEVVREPGVGAIRLAWWRDALADAVKGEGAARHAALVALAESGAARANDADIWQGIVEARTADFEPAPFRSLADMERYVDATAGGVLRLALRACGMEAEPAEPFARAAGVAWGLTGLLRAESFWSARGRRLTPGEGCAHADVLSRARGALLEASGLFRTLPHAAFAACGYVALTGLYLDALERGREPPQLIRRQVKLVVAAAAGKF